MDYDVDAAISRLDEMARVVLPDKTAIRGAAKTGAAAILRRVGADETTLFEKLEAYHEGGRSWARIADMLNTAAVLLNGGQWNEISLRVQMGRERRRRAKLAAKAAGAEAQGGKVLENKVAPPEAAPSAEEGGVAAGAGKSAPAEEMSQFSVTGKSKGGLWMVKPPVAE